MNRYTCSHYTNAQQMYGILNQLCHNDDVRYVWGETTHSKITTDGLVWLNPLYWFFGSEGHVALDNPAPGYDTILLRMIPGDLLSAFPHRQFHPLHGLLYSWAALPNSNPNACMPMQGCSLYHFYDGLWYNRPRGELTTYRARGGHATDWVNPTRFRQSGFSRCI